MAVKSANFTNFELNANVMTFKDENENIWFKAKDVASALGHTNPERVIRKYVRDKHKKLFKETQGETDSVTPFRGGFQSQAVFILEPGVYQLIFRSQLPSAERFQD